MKRKSEQAVDKPEDALVRMASRNLPDRAELSFNRSDVEKKIAFPAGKYTNPGPLLAPVLAAILTVGFYVVLAFVPDWPPAAMFTQRGAVPYTIVFFSAWAVMLLIIKQRKIRLQRRALGLKLLPTEDPGFVLTPASAEVILRNINRKVEDPQNFYLTRRIHNALANLRNVGRIGDVDEVLRTQADNDEGQVDSSYTVLRGFVWAIPVLGFIGTVWGLSGALGSFGGVLSSAQQMDTLRGALQDVTGGLSTAFETTLQGLVAALCIHMLVIGVRRREEEFLDECKDYCQKYVVGRLRLRENEEG